MIWTSFFALFPPPLPSSPFFLAHPPTSPQPAAAAAAPSNRFISAELMVFLQSCGHTVLSWREPKPIWDSISCLPALSTLKNHNNTELRQKFRTHYSLSRSQPKVEVLPVCRRVFRKAQTVSGRLPPLSAAMAYIFLYHALYGRLPAAPSEAAVVRNIAEPKKKGGHMWHYIDSITTEKIKRS